MLRGGVIMDVVNAEQAKVAEDAGAVAVMALERVPADIRRDGGVARMSDPVLIEGIQDAVTIPVMAKARIGHFAEAQVLQSLGVDFIDESEVLTPADEAHHIDKWPFTVPFVCGATNLGEALRRISRGRRDDPLQGRGGDRQHRRGGAAPPLHPAATSRAITRPDQAELYRWAKDLAAPIGLVQEIARAGGCRCPCSAPGDRHAGRCRAGDAARRGGRVRRLGHLQVARTPSRMASAIVEATAHYRMPSTWPRSPAGWARRCVAWSCRPSGSISPTRRVVGQLPPIGVLDLQGDVREHLAALGDVGREGRPIRRPADLDGIAGLVLPGGESTTLSMLSESTGLFEAIGARLSGIRRRCRCSGPAPGWSCWRARCATAARPTLFRGAGRGGPAQRVRAPDGIVRRRGGVGEGPALRRFSSVRRSSCRSGTMWKCWAGSTGCRCS